MKPKDGGAEASTQVSKAPIVPGGQYWLHPHEGGNPILCRIVPVPLSATCEKAVQTEATLDMEHTMFDFPEDLLGSLSIDEGLYFNCFKSVMITVSNSIRISFFHM